MSRPFVNLGSAPCKEKCVETGDSRYRQNAFRECQTYIQAIRNYLGYEPEGACLEMKGFDHGLGVFYEVVCFYDEANQAAVDYAFRCESQAPHTWEEGSVRAPPQAMASRKAR